MNEEATATGGRNRIVKALAAGCLLLLVGATHVSGAEAPPDVAFVLPESSAYTTSEGTVQLAWKVAGQEIGSTDLNFEIERATDAAFAFAELYYAGPENGTFVSGLPAGEFYFRARAIASDGSTGAWSKDPIRVTVQYASAALVKTLMLLGTFVFLATVVVIVRGHRHANRNTLVTPPAKA